MLAIAAFAIQAADAAVPATAPADFTAGVINGFNPSVDVHAAMMVCFTPDQKMADDTNAFIAAIKAKDFSTIKTFIATDEPMALVDTALCMSGDPRYAAIEKAYDFQSDIVKLAMADPDWQLHALAGIKGKIPEIKAHVAAATTKWDAADYYGAGQEIGAVDKIAFTYWIKHMNFL